MNYHNVDNGQFNQVVKFSIITNGAINIIHLLMEHNMIYTYKTILLKLFKLNLTKVHTKL